MIRVGIECESIEGPQIWGVGRLVNKLLEELANHPELGNEFKFFLYFKSTIPRYSYLTSPLFEKRLVGPKLLPSSFSLYYYVFLPVKLYFEKLDLTFFPNYMLPIIFRGKSLVMITEDIYYEIKAGGLPLRYRLAYRIFTGWAAKHATKIMAISETSKKNISRLFEINLERIVVNHLGINLPKSNLASNSLKNGIGRYILYAGQAFPRRHLLEAMLAFEKITPKFPNLRFFAVGKDKYTPPVIEKLVSEINIRLGREAIFHEDYVTDSKLDELYRGADLLVYISSEEAFGLPPLEALAYKTPALVANNEVSHELLNDLAFFVNNPNSVDSIASAMTNGLVDLKKRQSIVSNADKIINRFTWEKHFERFIDILRNIVVKRNG